MGSECSPWLYLLWLYYLHRALKVSIPKPASLSMHVQLVHLVLWPCYRTTLYAPKGIILKGVATKFKWFFLGPVLELSDTTSYLILHCWFTSLQFLLNLCNTNVYYLFSALFQVRKLLLSSPFYLPDPKSVEIMSGEEEGK